MTPDESRWMESLSMAGTLLEEQRRHELRALSPERALFFAEALFSIPWPADVVARRRRGSGLLEQQDLFRQAHAR